MKIVIQALKLFLLLTAITGIIYPLVITALGQIAFPGKANGSLIRKDGRIIGSSLLAQKFAGEGYFWPRPSAVDYNPLPSGGSNQGMTSALLDSTVRERRRALMEASSGPGDVPADLLLASGSGLDPHVSPEAALYQMDRVARARQLDNEQRKSLTNLVQNQIEQPTFGILGQPRVNILNLNLALDSALAGNGP
jgi:K+-transporting ATPase ATPase C chain